MAVNELRDHGFPYAKVTLQEAAGPNSKECVADADGQP